MAASITAAPGKRAFKGPRRGEPAHRGEERHTADYAAQWTQARRRRSIAAAARYTRFVQQLKVLLPAGALVIVLAVVTFSSINASRNDITFAFDEIEAQEDDLKMLNPKLNGVDKEGRPYTVTADYAQQIKGRADFVTLYNMQADVTLKDGQWVSISAGRGELDSAKETLTLTGDINVFSDRGYEMRTSAALVDFGNGMISGDKPVEGQGPLGVIKGNGFTVDQEKELVTFTGGVETTYIPPPHKKAK
ncbi:MAG: LPS export ABC transporter periplasmic protein LptC [Alphaproteobacteria bacterium]|nr:LPS export ABC transporter periplasmic protein LptC [Alphaproteobacteria bacterium]